MGHKIDLRHLPFLGNGKGPWFMTDSHRIIPGGVLLSDKTILTETIITGYNIQRGEIAIIEAGMLLDILRPKLEWENEQQAFKQNLNVMFSMLFSMLIAGLVIYFVVSYFTTALRAALFMLVFFTVLAVILYYLLMNWGIRRYQKLEP